MIRNTILLLATLGLLSSCGMGEPMTELEFTGVISKPGITSYQYGTHLITDGSKRYALTSEKVDLDDYIGEKVIVYGDQLEGYPIEGGPVFLAVERVEEYPE